MPFINDEIMSLADAWVGITHKMETLEKVPRDFGTGDLLCRSEIHTIMAIGIHEKINITELSKHFGISKSAISQMTRKLFESKLIEKRRDPQNDKEIFLTLTPKGKIAYQGHQQYHAKFDAQMLRNIGPLSPQEYKIIKKFVEAVELTADEFITKKM